LTTDATFTLNVAAPIQSGIEHAPRGLRVIPSDKVNDWRFNYYRTAPKAGPSCAASDLSLVKAGVAAACPEHPVIELHGASGAVIISMTTGRTARSGRRSKDSLPSNGRREAVILNDAYRRRLHRCSQGRRRTTGVGLIEVYDRNSALDSELANISTRVSS